MFLASREKRFARRRVRALLKAHAEVSAARPGLSGKPLYREVLLHSRQIDAPNVDEVMRKAEDSVDEWTAGGTGEMGFRELIHFLILFEYEAAGHDGAVVSFREIVYSLIPKDL